MEVLLDVLSDERGNIWLDAASPLEVHTEDKSPHRVAVRTSSVAAGSNQPAQLWLRFDRPQAYRLIDLLDRQLETATQNGAEGVTKNTVLKSPIKGGVNRDNGNMVLVFEGRSGIHHRFELPFDQSGPMMETLASAAKTAAEWNELQPDKSFGSLHRVNIQPYEAEWIMLGEDPKSGSPILVLRLVGGLQFSFLLDRKLMEHLRKRPTSKPEGASVSESTYDTVAEDLEWLREEWCTLFAPPSNADLRRGSAALRRLLVDNVVQQAWLQYGFKGEPKVAGPDMHALAAHQGFELKHVSSMIAGGACLNGIETAMIGGVRAFNPKTGKGPDEDEGFAVKVTSIVRDTRGPSEPNQLSKLVNHPWGLKKYLDAPAAIRVGSVISRREIIQYFANYAGGVHLDRGKQERRGKRREKTEINKIIGDLAKKVRADTMEGLHFELLSIGQAIGKSNDLQKLAAKIRASDAESH
jgi:hypothetical protein